MLGFCLVAAVIPAIPAAAFERDTHYHLTYALSLATCLDPDEAWIVASADWMLDENASTHAEMNPVQRRNKIQLHAFGHLDARLNELWRRAVQEPDPERRLILLGQFLHFLQDWEAHAGYGTRMGHGRDTYRGRDPDSLAKDDERSARMLRATLAHLLRFCSRLDRLDEDPDRVWLRSIRGFGAEGLLGDLIEQSDPSWRKGKMGGFRRRGREILAANARRVEDEVAAEASSAGLPPEGRAQGGIPDPLFMRYAADADILSLPGRDAGVATLDARRATTVPLPDLQVRVDVGRRWTEGWQVRAEVRNEGAEASSGAVLEVVIVDADDEDLIGEAARPLPDLAPGEGTVVRVYVPASARVDRRELVVGAFARSDDASAPDNVDWWMGEGALEDETEVPDADLDDPEGAADGEDVEFVGPWRWLPFGDELCLRAEVSVLEGDASDKLSGVRLLLGEPPSAPRITFGPVWHVSASDASEMTVAGVWSCLEVGDELCRAASRGADLALVVAVDGASPQRQERPIDLAEPELAGLCRP
ncbi:MAG: hypothetical protein R3190_01970 [Thermoanaerobaculia bacterium]|nr:hypothetical protein [Thermoanaerobaculia bacterium]